MCVCTRTRTTDGERRRGARGRERQGLHLNKSSDAGELFFYFFALDSLRWKPKRYQPHFVNTVSLYVAVYAIGLCVERNLCQYVVLPT